MCSGLLLHQFNTLFFAFLIVGLPHSKFLDFTARSQISCLQWCDQKKVLYRQKVSCLCVESSQTCHLCLAQNRTKIHQSCMSLIDEDSEEKQINAHVINCAFFCSYDRVGRTNLRRSTVLVGAINKGLVISLPALNPAPKCLC